MNPIRNYEVVGLIPGLTQWVKDLAVAVSCGVGPRPRRGSDMAWALAVALVGPLAQEPPHAADVP